MIDVSPSPAVERPAVEAPCGATVVVDGVTKRFGPKLAVADLSFEVRPGEILGFLGPNGAGKTTTMRMILDILRPDAGTISVFGVRPSYRLGSRVGYLPEERGLYRDIPVLESLTYLAALHGLSRGEAHRRATRVLTQVGLGDALGKKASELSRGMHQKAQVVATILHDPDLLIMDEPFQGLDPINADLLRTLLRAQRNRGAAVILSTHRMEDAEELCDRILLIDAGHRLLYGSLPEIRRTDGERTIAVHGTGLPTGTTTAAAARFRDGEVHYTLRDAAMPADLFRELAASAADIDRFEVATPSLEEIFIRTVERATSGRVH
jgi:ABC-2 type transport system ATP-binding protein